MLNINFVPEYLREDTSGLLDNGLGNMSREVILSLFVAVTALMLTIHVLLFVLIAGNHAKEFGLSSSWKNMDSDNKIVTDLMAQTQELQRRWISLKPITSQRMFMYSQLLNEISDSVPRGIWLRRVSYENNVVIIDGSAVSRVKSEMIISGNFVSAMKERDVFKKFFSSVDVDSMQGRNTGAAAIADFTLKARQKTTP